jgi:hypothetical protein
VTRMITDPDELERLLVPIMQREGFGIPQRGCYVAAVEFDEAGEVIAYQMLQNALFAEGLWAKQGAGADLRTLGATVIQHARDLGAQQMLTLTRTDEQGERIGRFVKRMGFTLMPLKIYRRTL